MSEQTAAIPLEDSEHEHPAYWLYQRFEYLRYVESDMITVKGVALLFVLLLLLRILWILIPLLFPSRNLRRRALQKKQN